jgi:3-deoxy-D-manno-octulosonic-acid transferase
MMLLDLGYLFFLLLSFPLWFRFLFKKKYRQLIRFRFSPNIEPGPHPNIWIHAVSVGEVKSLNRLISRLSQLTPHIVLSVTTPSGYRYSRNTYTGIRVISAPLDFSFVIRKFFKRIHPTLLILNELEIWPNWLRFMHRKKIPVILINGRISESAFKRYQRFGFLFRRFFNLIDFYFLQAEIHKKRFIALGIPESRMHVCGNIKADEAAAQLESVSEKSEILKQLKIKPTGKKVVTFASTHASDEGIIIPALPALREKFGLIIVPRHPDRSQKIRRQLDALHIRVALWTEGRPVDLEESVLIVDKIGFLFNIFAVSDIVFMGGAFTRKIGGHNLYEPAVQGKLILGGPHVNNFPTIGEELIRKNIYQIVRNSADLENMLLRLDHRVLDSIKNLSRQTVMEKRGSTDCILDHIRELTKP